MINKIYCILFILYIGSDTTAQRRTGAQLIRGGLVKIGFNAGPGFFVSPSVATSNVSGELEVYLNKRVSVRGDLSFYIPTPLSAKVVAHNHSLFWGLSYHMPFRRLDFFIGLQPGLSVVQSYKKDGNFTDVQAIPVISGIGGCQFYMTRFFHFYLTSRFIAGTYFRNADTPLNMTEFRIMAGVGFHINMVRDKKKNPDLD